MVVCQTGSPWWVNTPVAMTFAGALAFVILYAWRTRGAWRDTAVGRNVMALMAVILIVSALAVSAIIWGTDWPYRNPIRAAAWTAIAAVVLWRVVILLRIQHRRE